MLGNNLFSRKKPTLVRVSFLQWPVAGRQKCWHFVLKLKYLNKVVVFFLYSTRVREGWIIPSSSGSGRRLRGDRGGDEAKHTQALQGELKRNTHVVRNREQTHAVPHRPNSNFNILLKVHLKPSPDLVWTEGLALIKVKEKGLCSVPLPLSFKLPAPFAHGTKLFVLWADSLLQRGHGKLLSSFFFLSSHPERGQAVYQK